ncbi:sensor histidine kinase [Actinokineospora pegani]|uniref:sensor histidine kinase n=1 Tax=Actinokineospora pegani TaxID=2654637 RepID=UPI001F192332|nr:histidine kinase [Actinokineospora pegani]
MNDTADSGRRDRVADGGLFVFAVLAGIALVLFRREIGPMVPGWIMTADIVAGALGCLALWWRRRYPVVLAIVLVLLTTFSETASVAALVLLFTVALRRSTWAVVLLAVGSVLTHTVYQVVRPEPMLSTWMFVSWILLVHVAVVAGGLLRRGRRQLVASLRERAVAAEVEARLRTEHARLEAREALAREMHDVLGHRLSLLAINAGALAYHRAATAEDARRAAELIRESAHRALQDLREVISVLRAPDGDVPLPGVTDIAELVEETTRSGADVRLRDEPGVSTGALAVPAAVSRTLYRFVQEGLTNARKHAPAAPVAVTITAEPGAHLSAEVVNEAPPGHPVAAPPGSGAGLRGLAERVTLLGGDLQHGPTRTGGWRLEVRLPWPT